MFYNNRVTILEQWEDRKLKEIYVDIKAMIYRKKGGSRRDSSVSENTVKEQIVVCLEADKTNVRAGNIIRIENLFGKTKELKAGEPEIIPALYFRKLIEIRCDLT